MGLTVHGWDWALIFSMATMGTAIAYLRNPEQKALVLMLPVPFTLATLAVDRPVDATNVLGTLLLFGFTIGVWALRVRLRVPIVAAIAIAVTGDCLIGAAIARLNPSSNAAFWSTALITWICGAALVRLLPHRKEPHYRTPLPMWIKFPIIALVVVGIVQIKRQLGGFTTMFPMVGVVAAYEARHSLWTNVRGISWVLVLMPPMMASIRLWQPHVGMPMALALSWPVLLLELGLMYKFSKQSLESA